MRMRKKMAFQYAYYILAVANIIFARVGSSSRFQPMVLRQTMYYLIFQGQLKTSMPCVYEVIISATCWNVSKTYGVYVNFSDVAFDHFVLIFTHTHTNTYFMNYNMGLLKQTKF